MERLLEFASSGAIEPTSIPTRNTIVAAIKAGHEDALNELTKLLRACDAYSIMIDGWSMKTTPRGFIGVVVVFFHDGQLKRHVVDLVPIHTYSENAEFIADVVTDAMRTVGVDLADPDHKAKVLALVSDNAAVMGAAAKVLDLTFQGCLAHKADLLWKDASVQVSDERASEKGTVFVTGTVTNRNSCRRRSTCSAP